MKEEGQGLDEEGQHLTMGQIVGPALQRREKLQEAGAITDDVCLYSCARVLNEVRKVEEAGREPGGFLHDDTINRGVAWTLGVMHSALPTYILTGPANTTLQSRIDWTLYQALLVGYTMGAGLLPQELLDDLATLTERARDGEITAEEVDEYGRVVTKELLS